MKTENGVDREDRRERGVELGPEDAAFVARVREELRAPERTPLRNAAFDARLAERVRERPGGVPWIGALAGAAAAAVVGLFVLAGSESQPGPEAIEGPQVVHREQVPPGVGPQPASAGAPTSAAIEEALVALSYGYEYGGGDGDGSDESGSGSLDTALPNDYVAIESLFLGG